MLKQASRNLNVNQFADAAVAASRQLWLAGLGAASVTRRWAANDAGAFFRTLVKQGTVAESRAKHVINAEMEGSVARATRVWNTTRDVVSATVNTLAETALSVMPSVKPAARAKRKQPARKPVALRARKPAVATKRATKRGVRKA